MKLNKSNRIRIIWLAVILLFSGFCSAQPAANDLKKPKESTVYAWIVGISKYKYITQLQYADSDAYLFQQFLLYGSIKNVKPDNILSMYNDSAKGNTLIIEGLKWIENRAYNNGDKLFIYLAGHGDAIDNDEYFFLGSDIEPGTPGAKSNYIGGSTLQMYNLKIAIKRIVKKGVQVYLIMDACRTNENSDTKNPEIYPEGIAEKKVGDIMLYSASAGQSAFESSSIGGGHGLFSWYLVGGLTGEADKNGDGKITLYELMNYVQQNVSSEADKNFHFHPQFPVVCCAENYSKVLCNIDTTFHNYWLAKQAKSGSGSLYSAAKRSIDTAQVDTIISVERVYLDLFTRSMSKGNLIGDSSASFYIDKLFKVAPNSLLVQNAKYKLASECMNYAQDKINIYLRGTDQISERILDSANSTHANKSFKYKIVSKIPYNVAASMVARAMELLKDDTETTNKLRYKYYFLLSNSYFQDSSIFGDNRNLSKINNAILEIKKAIKFNSQAAYLYNTLGNLYSIKGAYAEAEVMFHTAIKLSPKWSYSYNNLGVAFQVQKKFDEANDAYVQAINSDTNYVIAYNNMGNLYNDQKKYEKAEEFYKKAIRKDPKFVHAQRNLIQLRKNGVYATIGDQTWKVENLDADHFQNGDSINQAKSNSEWKKCNEDKRPCWCSYKNDARNDAKFGKLYNWYAVNDPRGIAGKGWKIPTKEDFEKLVNAYTQNVAGKQLKSEQNWHNDIYDNSGNGTNESGFNGFPGGFRNSEGDFDMLGMCGNWWSKSEAANGRAWLLELNFNRNDARVNNDKTGCGYSVRCARGQ